MSVELVPVNEQGLMINPRTGVVISDASSDDDLADFLSFLREGRKLIDGIDGDVSEWLRARADARGKWTIAGGRVSMPSNRPGTSWDTDALITLLDELLAEGEIPDDMHASAVKVTRTLDLAAAKAILAGASVPVAHRFNACKVSVPVGSRKVRVS